MNDNTSISIIVPVLNEEGSLKTFYRETFNALKGFPEWEIIFIDDADNVHNPRALQVLKFSDIEKEFLCQ